MGNLKRVGSLSVLAAGLGIGAALAATPGVAFAGTSSVDGGAGALGVAGALAAAAIGDAAATVGTAAATTLPTLPSDADNFAISISGMPLLSLGTASASSSFGNIAIAFGDNADANAMSGFFNFALAEGSHSFAVVGDTGSFNYAVAEGDHASATAAWGSGNSAIADGDYAVASAGASVSPGVYDSNGNHAAAEGLHAIAYSGWDGSSNNNANAIGDYVQVYSPEGSPFNPAT